MSYINQRISYTILLLIEMVAYIIRRNHIIVIRKNEKRVTSSTSRFPDEKNYNCSVFR